MEQEVTARGQSPEVWHQMLAGLAAVPLDRLDPVSSVTVVVPHPDDETLGCGGLLHRLSHTGGARVSVVFVSDGAAGYPGCSAGQAGQLAAVRRVEARTALRTLGLTEATVHFLDIPDGGISDSESELAEFLADQFAEDASDGLGLCLAPWPDDPHPDHQATGRAARAATGQTGTELWQYPIWMRHSIRPDDPIVDVDRPRLRVLRLTPAEQVAKRIAIETHASQLRSPFPGYGPVLPEHVLDLFADGLEPFFLPAPTRSVQ